MLFEEISEAIEAARPAELQEVGAIMWRAFGTGAISEVEAERLSARIEARRELKAIVPPAPLPRVRMGSRPRSPASVERRRRWMASGFLPPRIACHFTAAEHAALAVVAAEIAKRGSCQLAHEAVAAIAGVCRSTVKAALRQARALGFLTIKERRISRCRNATNVVRIIAREWTGWLQLRRSSKGVNSEATIGGKISTGTITKVFKPANTRPMERAKAVGKQGSFGLNACRMARA